MEVGMIRRVDIDETMRSAYLSYAMSVITARALPDVRDGLKPVQRRILYAMHDMGLNHDHPTRKSARIVGEVLGKYHPHGDSAVYDAMVRMAQDFSMRYPLIEGQGNFGSVDGDDAAAMRYTEARLSAVGEELLIDLEKNTVDFTDNFDGSLKEPTVLPAKFPNLLVNGVGGIAVGMATNIPPHNLAEIADAIAYLIDHYGDVDAVSVDDLMRFVKGPDFPTGGTILGWEGIRQAYATGKGRVVVRAHAHIEDMKGGHSAIIVTELPYQVNKSTLVERIAKLVRDDRIQGISDLRDESDRTGMRVVVELKRGAEPGPVLGHLLKYTQMQNTFGVNMLALVDGEPRLLSLKRTLVHYIAHRHEVLQRRSQHELEKAQARAHILEGLLLALEHLDEVIDTIRRSRTVDTARQNLCKRFKLTEIQAQAILETQLRRLAALERRRLEEEYQELLTQIKYLRSLLASEVKLLGLVRDDVLETKKAHGDARRTRISDSDESTDLHPGDLVPDEEVCVLLTRGGYVLRRPVSACRDEGSGGIRLSVQAPDPIQSLFVANSQESVAFFTDKGRVCSLHVHQLPDTSQQEQGLPLSTLIRMVDDEGIVEMVRIGDLEKDAYICMGTRKGRIKRLAVGELVPPGRGFADVIGLADGDTLGWVVLTRGNAELVMVTEQGQAIRFAEDTVRPQGLTAMGVRGITLKGDDVVVALDIVREAGELLLATAFGFAKRSPLQEYGAQGRGGQGALTMDVAKIELSGPIVAAMVVDAGEQIAFATTAGKLIRSWVKDIPVCRRASWGRLVTRSRRGAAVKVEADDRVVALARLFSPTDLTHGEPAVVGKSKEPTRKTGAASAGKRAKPGRKRAVSSGKSTGTRASLATEDIAAANQEPQEREGKPLGRGAGLEPAKARGARVGSKGKSTDRPQAEPTTASTDDHAATPESADSRAGDGAPPTSQSKRRQVRKPTVRKTPRRTRTDK